MSCIPVSMKPHQWVDIKAQRRNGPPAAVACNVELRHAVLQGLHLPPQLLPRRVDYILFPRLLARSRAAILAVLARAAFLHSAAAVSSFCTASRRAAAAPARSTTTSASRRASAASTSNAHACLSCQSTSAPGAGSLAGGAYWAGGIAGPRGGMHTPPTITSRRSAGAGVAERWLRLARRWLPPLGLRPLLLCPCRCSV